MPTAFAVPRNPDQLLSHPPATGCRRRYMSLPYWRDKAGQIGARPTRSLHRCRRSRTSALRRDTRDREAGRRRRLSLHQADSPPFPRSAAVPALLCPQVRFLSLSDTMPAGWHMHSILRKLSVPAHTLPRQRLVSSLPAVRITSTLSCPALRVSSHSTPAKSAAVLPRPACPLVQSPRRDSSPPSL